MSPHKRHPLGELLRRQRISHHLSQRAVGRATGIPATTIMRLETGEIERPDPQLLARIARVLDADLADYYTLAGYPLPQGLPGLMPYLRTATPLTDDEIAQIQTMIDQKTSSTSPELREGGTHEHHIDSTSGHGSHPSA